MSGMLGSGGGYRRAVLAVAVTGTVCAGVGLAWWYLGEKKFRPRESSLSPSDSETEPQPGKAAAVKDDQESVQSEGKVPQAPAASEKTKPVPGTSVQATPSFQPKVSDKPPPQSAIPQPLVEKAKDKVEEVKASKVAESVKSPAETAKVKAEEIASKVGDMASGVKEKAKETISAKDKVEEVKASKVAESVKSSAETAKVKAEEIASKVGDIASGVKEKAKETFSAIPTKDQVVSSVDNVVETVKEQAKKKLEVIGGKASGDGPASLSSMESRLDSDIVVIEDTKEAVDKAIAAVKGAGDVSATPINPQASAAAPVPAIPAPSVQVPAKEMLPTHDLPSMGALSSLGDDIEIIHDSPSMGTVEDSLSGDFVKCDKNTDLSQSIEVIKAAAKPEEKKPEEKKPQEKKPEEKKPEVKKPEPVKVPDAPKPAGLEGKSVGQAASQVKPKQPEGAGFLGDSNANFDPPSASAKKETVSGIPKPTKKHEPKEKQPEEKK